MCIGAANPVKDAFGPEMPDTRDGEAKPRERKAIPRAPADTRGVVLAGRPRHSCRDHLGPDADRGIGVCYSTMTMGDAKL